MSRSSIKGFELEIALNKFFLDQKFKIKVVYVKHLYNVLRYKKRGIVKGNYEIVKMGMSLIKKFGFLEILRQMYFISLLSHFKRKEN